MARIGDKAAMEGFVNLLDHLHVDPSHLRARLILGWSEKIRSSRHALQDFRKRHSIVICSRLLRVQCDGSLVGSVPDDSLALLHRNFRLKQYPRLRWSRSCNASHNHALRVPESHHRLPSPFEARSEEIPVDGGYDWGWIDQQKWAEHHRKHERQISRIRKELVSYQETH